MTVPALWRDGTGSGALFATRVSDEGGGGALSESAAQRRAFLMRSRHEMHSAQRPTPKPLAAWGLASTSASPYYYVVSLLGSPCSSRRAAPAARLAAVAPAVIAAAAARLPR